MKGNNQQGAPEIKSQDNLSGLTAGIMMFWTSVLFLGGLAAGWHAYSPDPWLPMPPPSTFIIVSILVYLFMLMWIKRCAGNAANAAQRR